MANKIIEIVKKHPVSAVVVVLVVFVGVYLLASSGGGSASSSSAGVDPTTAATLAEQEQTNQDSLTAASMQDQFQLAYLQQQQVLQGNEDAQSYNLSVANLGDQYQVATQTLATQLASLEYSTNATTTQQQDQLNAEIEVNANNNATQSSENAAFLQEQEFGIAAQSNLQTVISNNQTIVAQGQTQAATQIAQITAGEQEYIAGQTASVQKAQIGASETGGILGFLGSIF